MNHPYRLLVVDRDPDVRGVIEDLLSPDDYDLRSAASAHAAALALRRDYFDIVLCHLELLRSAPLRESLRKHEPRPRVVAMSASWSDSGVHENGLLLSKPFTRMGLIAALGGE